MLPWLIELISAVNVLGGMYALLPRANYYFCADLATVSAIREDNPSIIVAARSLAHLQHYRIDMMIEREIQASSARLKYR